MKVICILCDSLNRHFLSAYGSGLARTPNIDWLASRSAVFLKHYSGSVPTMPTRREVWTGNHEFLWRPWGALEPWDQNLVELIARRKILTSLITDSYHLFEGGSSNYHFSFEGWEFFRGFEGDPWITDPTPMPEHVGALANRYVRNMTRMTHEEGLPPVKTLQHVERWLRANYQHEQFFLMVDEFAPHEPFNAPDYLVRSYDPDWKGPLLFWPLYGRNRHEAREVEHLRACYAAHVTLVDKYLGRIFEAMTDLDMWKDTALILMTDHGHFLGEHGYTGKPNCPQYNTLVHIPLMMHVPDSATAGKHIDALTANVDIFATILDLFGIKPERKAHGRSLLPLVQGRAEKVRDHALYGYFGKFVNYTDGNYTYFRAPVPDGPLNIYSLRWEFGKGFQQLILQSMREHGTEIGSFMDTADIPVGRVSVPSSSFAGNVDELANHLYDLKSDPDQNRNLAGNELESSYASRLGEAMREIDAPSEQYERLGL